MENEKQKSLGDQFIDAKRAGNQYRADEIRLLIDAGTKTLGHKIAALRDEFEKDFGVRISNLSLAGGGSDGPLEFLAAIEVHRPATMPPAEKLGEEPPAAPFYRSDSALGRYIEGCAILQGTEPGIIPVLDPIQLSRLLGEDCGIAGMPNKAVVNNLIASEVAAAHGEPWASLFDADFFGRMTMKLFDMAASGEVDLDELISAMANGDAAEKRPATKDSKLSHDGQLIKDEIEATVQLLRRVNARGRKIESTKQRLLAAREACKETLRRLRLQLNRETLPDGSEFHQKPPYKHCRCPECAGVDHRVPRVEGE